MKIDLDLSDIYEDEDGCKMRMEFRDSVIASIAHSLRDEIRTMLKEQVGMAISKLVKENIEDQVPKILNDFLDYEFIETSSWGEKKPPYTVRKKIAQVLQEAVGFERKDFWSTSKETPFTKLIVSAIQKEIEPLSKQMSATMNLEFRKACVNEAAKQLEARMK